MPSSAAPSTCPSGCLECWLLPALDRRSCDGTPALVEEWLTAHGVLREPVLRFLRSRGGFCSCEIVMNALDRGRTVLDDVVLACGR